MLRLLSANPSFTQCRALLPPLALVCSETSCPGSSSGRCCSPEVLISTNVFSKSEPEGEKKKQNLQVINERLLLLQWGESTFEESHEFHKLSLPLTQEVFPGLCESCDGMAMWDHSLVLTTAKCSCVDREVLVEWHNHAKWLFYFCQPWESSCPGVKAASAEEWWHREHLPVQLCVS